MKEDVFHLGVKGLIKNSEGKHLLLKKNSKNIKGLDKTEFWDLPGGRKEKKVTERATLLREIKEETGITDIKITKKIFTFVTDKQLLLSEGVFGLILTVFECDTNQDNIKLSDEHIEYKWVDKSELNKLLRDYPEEFFKYI